jgi:hypothetical protein
MPRNSTTDQSVNTEFNEVGGDPSGCVVRKYVRVLVDNTVCFDIQDMDLPGNIKDRRYSVFGGGKGYFHRSDHLPFSTI